MIELVPDRKLIDNTFNGYRVNFQEIPSDFAHLPAVVDVAEPDPEQYSYLETCLFGSHNHLFFDPWNPEKTLYYVDNNWEIIAVNVNVEEMKISSIKSVWEVPQSCNRKPGRYSVSLIFADEERALLSDGLGTLFVINTGNRCSSEYRIWQVENALYPFEEKIPFLLRACRFSDKAHPEENKLHVLLLKTEKGLLPGDKSEKAQIGLYWFIYASGESGDMKVAHREKMITRGFVRYGHFSGDCTQLLVGVEKALVFPDRNKNPTELPVKKEEPNYYWQQSAEDIQVWFGVPSSCNSEDVNVEFEDRYVHVEVNGVPKISGTTLHRIDANLTTWEIKHNRLEITLFKSEEGLMWQNVIEDDETGEQVVDPELVKQIHERLAELCSESENVEVADADCDTVSFNMQQLESCDASYQTDMMLYSIDSETFDVTDKVNIGSHQWLFSTVVENQELPLFCVRHDVDGFIWKLNITPDKKCSCTHVATVNALGYINASKESRFVACASDLSYVAISQWKDKVFVYREAALSSTLYNRKTCKKYSTVGIQHVLNAKENEYISGIHAADKFLVVLNQTKLLVFFIGALVNSQ